MVDDVNISAGGSRMDQNSAENQLLNNCTNAMVWS